MTTITETPPLEEAIDEVARFHGHMCPGLAMGVQAAQVALRGIGPHANYEEVVTVVETDECALDAIRLFTGCSFGNGNRIHRGLGKNAYTVQEVTGPPPRGDRIASVTCARCGWLTMATRIRRLDGCALCPPCFDTACGGEQPFFAAGLDGTR